MPPWIRDLSSLSTLVIAGLFVLHLLAFFVLWLWSLRDRRRIRMTLFHFTKGLSSQSLTGESTGADQIDSFIADIGDVLHSPSRAADREALHARIQILDERRSYLQSGLFPTASNVARTMIEAYPLLGVLGTILAIGAALQGADVSVQDIVARFGDAIWSTGAGLTAGIILLFVNGVLEPGFQRLIESRQTVRETVAKAKRELALRVRSEPRAVSEELA